MRANELIGTLRPGQVADLGAGVDRLECMPRNSVPESDGLIRRPPTGGQDAVLVGRPSNGLDRSRVLPIALERDWREGSPHKKLRETGWEIQKINKIQVTLNQQPYYILFTKYLRHSNAMTSFKFYFSLLRVAVHRK